MTHVAILEPRGNALPRFLAQGYLEPREVADAIEGLLDVLDKMDNHEDVPDFSARSDGLPGTPEDHEKGGDEESAAWVEWDKLGGSRKGGANLTLGDEDKEDDDPDGGQVDEDVPGFEPRDLAIANAFGGSGPGCPIGDPDYGHDGS